MEQKIKSVHVCFPQSGERREMSFFHEDMKSITVIYQFLIKNGALITQFEGFQDWEIRLLAESKDPSGASLYQPECCDEDDPDSSC
jgi:hypothetical protein